MEQATERLADAKSSRKVQWGLHHFLGTESGRLRPDFGKHRPEERHHSNQLVGCARCPKRDSRRGLHVRLRWRARAGARARIQRHLMRPEQFDHERGSESQYWTRSDDDLC